MIVLLTQLIVLVFTLASSSLPHFNWELLALASLQVHWITLLSAAVLCLLRGFFSHYSLALASLGCMLVILVITGFTSLVAANWLPRYGEQGVGWILRNLVVATVCAGMVLRYFYLRQQLQLRERAEATARLESLRARIRPHFLFNTLNSIASLIETSPQRAERAVEDLSELFRASLAEGQRPTSVHDEVHLCELYLGIEKLRLGDRLQVAWQVSPTVRQQFMPSLLLQPLVENAIYHGIARLPEGGCVRIKIEAEGGALCVTLTNPVPTETGSASGHRMALDNIRQRLDTLFEGQASLAAFRDDGEFRVVLQYPLADSGSQRV